MPYVWSSYSSRFGKEGLVPNPRVWIRIVVKDDDLNNHGTPVTRMNTVYMEFTLILIWQGVLVSPQSKGVDQDSNQCFSSWKSHVTKTYLLDCHRCPVTVKMAIPGECCSVYVHMGGIALGLCSAVIMRTIEELEYNVYTPKSKTSHNLQCSDLFRNCANIAVMAEHMKQGLW